MDNKYVLQVVDNIFSEYEKPKIKTVIKDSKDDCIIEGIRDLYKAQYVVSEDNRYDIKNIRSNTCIDECGKIIYFSDGVDEVIFKYNVFRLLYIGNIVKYRNFKICIYNDIYYILGRKNNEGIIKSFDSIYDCVIFINERISSNDTK